VLSSTNTTPLLDAGLFTQLAFSRDLEQDADIAGVWWYLRPPERGGWPVQNHPV